MSSYNRSITLLGTAMDKAHEANKRRKAAKNIESGKSAIRKDIEMLVELIHPGTSLVKSSEHIIVNSSEKWSKRNVKGNETELNEKLAKLNELNFYDIIANTSQTGEELMNKTIQFNSLNNKVIHSNQRGTANESLNTWNESYEYLQSVKEKKGSLFGWDLETTGGKDLNGIWRPESITEFAIQEYDFGTNNLKKTNVLVGISEDEGEKIYREIEQAIKMGTLDADDRLKVTAMRYSKYGSNDFKMEKVAGKGYYQATNFPVHDDNNYKNLEQIKAGINRFVKAGKYSRENAINGVPADIAAIAESMNLVMRKANEKMGSLIGQNDSGFDQLVLNGMFGKWNQQYGKAFADLFDNNVAAFNIASEANLDIFGGTKLFTEYNPISKLYAGYNMHNIKKVRGQEYLVEAHLGEMIKTLRPHMAEDDVTALLGLVLNPSEAPELLGKNISFVDYINSSLSKVNYQKHELGINQHVLRAKKRYGQDTNTGKGFMHFSQSKRHGTVITPNNHMIGIGDAALEANGGVLHEGFNLGFGINKGSFYDILDIKQVTVNDEIRKVMGEISPEYAGKNFYHVQLGMVVDSDYKSTRLDDLTQNFIFKSEKEMNAFLSGYFDVVAEKVNGDIKIVQGMEKHFDRRELRNRKGKANLKQVNKTAIDAEAFNSAVRAENERLLISRADNSILGNNSLKKIEKALNLKAELQEALGVEIKGSDISTIMSEKVAKGQMALNLTNENKARAQDIIKTALEYNAHNTKRLLDSSVDNMATGITMISSYEKMLSTVLNTLNQTEEFTNKSDSAKQEIFSRVIKEVKRVTADHIYEKEGTSIRMQLGNKRLTSSFENFKNMYEIDYSSLIKGNRVNFVDSANPMATANILKLDLSNSNSIYSLINTAVDSVYGSTKRYKEDIYKQNAIEKMFSMLNQTDLGNTKAFKNAKKQYGFNGREFELKKFHQDDIAQTIIEGMKQLKSKNATNGIINLDYAYMKSLEGHKAYSAALNSDRVLTLIPDIVKNVSENFKYSEVTNFKSSETLAKSLVEKHYMPSIDAVKSVHGNDRTIMTLYNNAKKDITDYLADVIYSASGIEGTTLSVQDNGALVISRNGRYESLENLIPKVKMHQESGVLYTELGSMKMQLGNVLDFKSTGPAIQGRAGTSLSSLNEYKMHKGVKYTASTKGADDAVDRLLSMLRINAKEIRQLPTINGFGGNDIDSNFGVDASNIKKVLKDLFQEGGKNNSVINNTQFLDKNLVKTIRDKLDEYGDRNIEDLDAETIRNLSKNMQHLLNAIVNFNTAGNSEDFKYLAENLSFTGSEKKVSAMIGIKGYRPTNSTFSIFDNTQRPPVTQSGNAIHLRVGDIEKAKGVTAGNLISFAQMDKRTMRDVNGIGKTTTDMMMNISYLDSTGLRALIDSNYAKITSENNIDFQTQKAVKKAVNYIRNSVSTFEQERIMDSRIHESVYGLRTAATQKLSKNYDLTASLKGLSGKDFDKQVKAMLDHRGTFTMVDGTLQFNSSTGRLVKKGESVLKWKGFAGIDNDFSSKMQYGVFNFNFYKEDGMKVRDSEINAILKSNQSRFLDSNGVPLTQAEMIANLESLLSQYGMKGQYAIEDISAMGYVKTMTSGVEKGMTDIVYTSTGSYDKTVENFFKKINKWDIVKGKVLTDEAIDAIIGSANDRVINSTLKSLGLNSVNDVKSLIAKERHMHSTLLFDSILGGKTHMIANDAVAKHANIGQMYQGTLSKAIDILSKEYNDSNKAITEIAGLMSSNKYGFIQKINLNATSSKDRVAGIIGAKNVNGRLMLDSDFISDNNIVTSLDSNKFKALIEEIDSRIIKGEKIVTTNAKGEKVYGSHIIVGKDIMGTNTRETVKYVRDPETQTSITAEYFNLKQESSTLKRKKIELETAKAKGIKINEAELTEIKARLRVVQDDLSSYNGAVKEMRFGDQELSIVERIAITDAHASQIQDLIDKGELDTDVLRSTTLGKYVNIDKDGKAIVTESLSGQQALSKLTKQLKNQQYFDRYTDTLLKEEDLKDHPYLKEMYDYAKKHDILLGKDAALKQHQINLAQKASFFNDGELKHNNVDDLLKAGFEERHISDVLFNADGIVEKNILVDLGKEFGADRYIALPGTGMTVADEEIKSLAHSKLNRLKALYDEYADFGGNDNEARTALMERISEQRKEVMDSIDKIVYGKHGLKHNAARIEIDAVSYRLKSSGIITDTTTEDLTKIAKQMGVEVLDESQGLTKKSLINGISIAEWESKHNAFFDYKYVSREKMSDMGYFEDDTLKQFGFLKKGVSKEQAIEQMEEHLRVHGTFDVTDRYPNTRSGSLNLTKVFMDDNLQGNQTKVSVATMLKANGDNDGDSFSSFRVELLDGKKKVDGALYELAKLNGGRDSGYMSPEIYDEFEKMENVMTTLALTDNKKWQKDAAEKIKKDLAKNIDLSNPDNMVLVPGGQSILGKHALSSIGVMPSLEEFHSIEKQANNILETAYNVATENKEIFNTTIDKAGNSAELLDKALTVIKENKAVSESELISMENTAIKRVGIDRYAQEMMAKTGLAATGSVNLSLNAVKLAAHFSSTDINDLTFTNYVWDVLDTAEQGVISSKKLQGGGYDDTTITEFKDAMKSIFKSGQSVASDKSIDKLATWLDKYGDNVFEVAYKNIGNKILSEKQLSYLNTLDDSEGLVQGANMMKELFLKKIKDMTADQVAMSYIGSIEGSGRNGAQVKEFWKNGSIAIAAADGKSMTAIEQGMSGFANEKQLMMALEDRMQKRQAQAQNQYAQSKLDANDESARAAKEALEQLVENATKAVKTTAGGSGIGTMGKVAIGVATGLMVGGYASGNPLNDKSAQQVSDENQAPPIETMSIPDFMDKQGGYVTGNSQQGYIINIKADTKKGRKHMEKIMARAAEATVGGAVSVNMNITNVNNNGGITDRDIENYMNKFI